MSQSLDRAMTILITCAEGPQRLSGLAQQLDVHRSTVLRLLQTMAARNFVRRQDDGRWTIGLGLTSAALSALDRIETRAVANPWLRRLARDLGHTIHLAELFGSDIIYVDKVEGRGAVRMNSRVAAPVQIHTAAVAKAILAFSTPDVVDSVLADLTYQRFTSTTLTTQASFRRELATVRAQGWAVDDGEFEDYISCIAVPIRDRTGSVQAGISITALRAIEPLGQLKLNIPRLTEAAQEISSELGWDGKKGLTDDGKPQLL